MLKNPSVKISWTDKIFTEGKLHKDGKERAKKKREPSTLSGENVERCKSEEAFQKTLKEKKLEDECYTWYNDQIMCLCCNKYVAVARKMLQHSQGKKHIKMLKQWKKEKVC